MSMLSLRVLILFQNEITSALPDFAALPCLEHIDLSYNKFTGLINFCFILPRIRKVLVCGPLSACFAGGIPESIGQLAGLKQLHLEQNQLTGSLFNNKAIYQSIRPYSFPNFLYFLDL